MDPLRELKVRAEILHRRIRKQDPAANVRRRDCLAAIAAGLGFPDWLSVKQLLTGHAQPADFGTVLCPARCGGHLNRWYARYEEAAAARDGGFLLAYRRQYLVVDRYYIESLGLSPDDPDWAAIGYDWARPRDPAARSRLFARLMGPGNDLAV